MNSRTRTITVTLVLAITLVAFSLLTLTAHPSQAALPSQENATGTPTPSIDPAVALETPAPLPAPNPASFYCGQQGGNLEINAGPDGAPVGICLFADGSQCEEWAYFRGECAPTPPTSTPPPTAIPAPKKPNMTNPASSYCVKKGGRVKIVTNTDGSQTGVCIFRNGSQCEEWAYYYGKCNPAKPTPAPTRKVKNPDMRNPASVYCEKNGGRVQIMTMMDGGEVGICVFPGGGQCEEWAYYNGECQP